MSISRQFEDALDLLYPPVCGICALPADSEDRLICVKCWERVDELEGPYCLTCRRIIDNRPRCRDCGDDAIPVYSLGYYTAELQTIIHDLKFNSLKPIAASLSRKMADFMRRQNHPPIFDGIIPTPLHDRILFQRGFNQSEEIARGLAVSFGLPLYADHLYMCRKTKQQSKLSASRREANVKGAFAVEKPADAIRGKSILIVDDVTTTGATLREIARVLKFAGVGQITAAVAATAA